MSKIIHNVVLSGNSSGGDRLPRRAVGQTLVAIQTLVKQSVQMVFRGQSTLRGKRPRWLLAASDVALVDVVGGEETILSFDTPTLGDVAPSLFDQGEFAWTNRPNREDTGFDVLVDVLRDVQQANTESDRFDTRLLAELWVARRIFDGSFSELALTGRREPAFINPTTLVTAKQLHDKTPQPQAAIIVGKLDMIRDSTHTFALIMDDGQEVRGTLADKQVGTLTDLFKQRVAVSGRAVFRASGRLLRTDADSVRIAAPSDEFFAKVPRPNATRP